ncbi:unnamed protein product [Mytilus coruscus]|uniref:Uncharacterized protein n=1 Tax=Mytilus coruscus TaxID=42192 RepID=A0A6J8A4D1_MYTCO|nr:unnamed protein product [Mytilus coruscus]
MELLNCHVPFDRVDPIIKSVLSLCKLKAKDETLPKKEDVSSVNVHTLAISQAHIAETCIEENRTLYTDETRKNRQSYGVFIKSNENQEPCLWGLKHMPSKASKTELDPLKEILKEIGICSQYLQNENPSNLTCNIFKEWEQTVMNKQAVRESSILKTVIELCKAFVPSVDNKNGVSLELKTYLSRVDVKFQLKALQVIKST